MARQPKKPVTTTHPCPRCSETVVRIRKPGKWVWRHLTVTSANADCWFKQEGKHWDEAWT